jgi:predicted nucleic acid-binding protein
VKAYLDTSVVNVLLFSEHSVKDKKRHPSVKELFDKIDAGLVPAIISLYSFQEIFAFCKMTFSVESAGYVAREAMGELCKHQFELIGLLTRMERLIYKRNFVLDDSTDQPHAIAAHIHNCDYFVTYDHHFDPLKNRFRVVTPAELLKELEASSS